RGLLLRPLARVNVDAILGALTAAGGINLRRVSFERQACRTSYASDALRSRPKRMLSMSRSLTEPDPCSHPSPQDSRFSRTARPLQVSQLQPLPSGERRRRLRTPALKGHTLAKTRFMGRY